MLALSNGGQGTNTGEEENKRGIHWEEIREIH
jgi:hypothetical protein